MIPWNRHRGISFNRILVLYDRLRKNFNQYRRKKVKFVPDSLNSFVVIPIITRAQEETYLD